MPSFQKAVCIIFQWNHGCYYPHLVWWYYLCCDVLQSIDLKPGSTMVWRVLSPCHRVLSCSIYSTMNCCLPKSEYLNVVFLCMCGVRWSFIALFIQFVIIWFQVHYNHWSIYLCIWIKSCDFNFEGENKSSLFWQISPKLYLVEPSGFFSLQPGYFETDCAMWTNLFLWEQTFGKFPYMKLEKKGV